MSKLDPFSAFLRRQGLGVMQNTDDDPPAMTTIAHRIQRLETELQSYLHTGASAGEGSKDGEGDR